MALTDLVAVPAGINQNVMNARQATMLALLGNPRDSYDQECREITNPRLAELMTTDRAGPLHVRGLRPAVESLKQVVADIKNEVPAVFDALGTAGMFCARLVRGSQTSISNHSWGTAIDLTLDGVLDERGDNRVQVGLTGFSRSSTGMAGIGARASRSKTACISNAAMTSFASSRRTVL